MHKIFIILLIVTSTLSFSQQELFIPREIISAYENGTRSLNGNPGAEYWQNSAEYKIKAEVIPEEFLLNGYEEITYSNNSPDTLRQIVIRLYQNIMRAGVARDFSFKNEGLTDGIILEEIKVNDSEIDIKDRKQYYENGTVAHIKLSDPLPPGNKIDLTFEWSFEIPFKDKLRMGAYDSTSYFIAYWYPQIAVYDDINGWDTYWYTGYQEMYNDFSDFEVEINVPNNFAVWSTGELKNPEDVLTEKYLNRYLKAQTSDEVLNIVDSIEAGNENIFNAEKSRNVWEYSTKNISDFAFAMSDKYVWDAVSVVVDSTSLRRAFIEAVYLKDTEDFYHVAKFSKQIIEYFSFEMPGISYPFYGLTAFNSGRGGGGMEFPMMINDGNSSSLNASLRLTAHEIAHQYFPFYMGTNEKRYAFMDEGWAVFLPFDLQEKNTDDGTARRVSTVISYQNFAGKETEIPPMIPSFFLTRATYRNAAYNRPSLAYYFLEDLLGKDVFISTLQEFITRWHGKHPTAYDFFFTFNEVSQQNLNWFWKPWFFERGFPDLELDKVRQLKDGYEIVVRKIGIIPIPIRLIIYFDENTEEELYFSAAVWKDGIDEYVIEYKTEKNIIEVNLGSENIPDSNPSNNKIIAH
ncbi:MAG: M1 family metallopeptidase [Ignavibacteria bacterium]|nr:M1 family metallopeptidase [Ignavibacteria bacterium]